VLSRTGLDAALGALCGSSSTPLILGYHRAAEDPAAASHTSLPDGVISCRMLEQHLDWLASRFQIVSLDELGSHLKSGKKAGHLAAVTFDDGYRDFYTDVFPLMKRKGIPPAVFVVTNLVGTSRMQLHDKLYVLLERLLSDKRRTHCLHDVLGRLGISHPGTARMLGPFQMMRALLVSTPHAELQGLTDDLAAQCGFDESATDWPGSVDWDMLSEMHRAGVTIGSHGRSHALLTNEFHQTVVHETAGSREDLKRWLGITARHFAYPDGRFDRQTVSAVAASGYGFAYTTCAHRDPHHPLLTIRRRMLTSGSCLNLRGHFSPTVMACLSNSVFDLATRCQQAHRDAGRGIVSRERPVVSAPFTAR
jgi:peptidoglycan/xylan/chitin deacetylase (PgdA/CDA1 family)